MHLRLGRPLALACAVSVLAGCPEERPDAKRPLPRERFPPAMPVQQPRREAAGIGPAPARVPAGSAAPVDSATSPSSPAAPPLPERGPAPAPAGTGAPAR